MGQRSEPVCKLGTGYLKIFTVNIYVREQEFTTWLLIAFHCNHRPIRNHGAKVLLNNMHSNMNFVLVIDVPGALLLTWVKFNLGMDE